VVFREGLNVLAEVLGEGVTQMEHQR
jgi:hypothetical protein